MTTEPFRAGKPQAGGDVRELLGGVPTLAGLSADDLQDLAASARRRGLVQDWVSGSAFNRGVMVKALDEMGERGGLLAAFGSRERAAGERPELVASYVD
jgi:hypothetical protein